MKRTQNVLKRIIGSWQFYIVCGVLLLAMLLFDIVLCAFEIGSYHFQPNSPLHYLALATVAAYSFVTGFRTRKGNMR